MAPDAFDIIDVQANQGLTSDQRRNLGSIAKMLQFASANKGVCHSFFFILLLSNCAPCFFQGLYAGLEVFESFGKRLT